MTTRSEPHSPELPPVIAPISYWLELEERTGGTDWTPESFLWWTQQDGHRRVEISKDLIALYETPSVSSLSAPNR